MTLPHPHKIIIAGISSRIYVEAAVKIGYEVIAIDAFMDVDVKALAVDGYQIGLRDDQLDGDALIAILDNLDLQGVMGFCYGAGFEKCPAILTQVNQRLPVLGNMAAVVEQSKLPTQFFDACDQLQIRYPLVAYAVPPAGEGWVIKAIGGCGGAHIKALAGEPGLSPFDYYYQKIQNGTPVSCLFLVSHCGVEVIGINEQWPDGSGAQPYRYGGAINHVDLDEQVRLHFVDYVTQLATKFGLIGINSCDAIYDGEDIFVLEINPRLSATMDLCPGCWLMAKHIAACTQASQADYQKKNGEQQIVRAHQIIYTAHALKLKNDIIWPEWVRDVPHAGEGFNEGSPVCTVVAEATTASLTKTLLAERVSTIKNILLN